MKKFKMLLLIALLALGTGLYGCSGDDGSAGQSAYELAVVNGFTGTEAEWLASLDPKNPLTAAANVDPESCATCHNGNVARAGSTHQAAYDELFQQGVVTVSNVTYTNDTTNDIVTFKMQKNGGAFDCTQADSVSIVFSEYITATDTFELGAGGFNYGIGGTLAYDAGTGVCTSTKAQGAKGDLNTLNGNIIVYGFDELVMADPVAHLNLARYPFATILEVGTVGYASAANATGCENCHTTPYFKHGYIIGDESQTGTNDFQTCKACHLDDLSGGHTGWQYMVDDPQGWAAGTALTATQAARYAYKKNLMNDVHMSHAMEFPYPQSMATCNTCHEGKLTQVLSDANFSLETCKSCHPIDGGKDTADADGKFAYDTTGIALSNLLPASIHGNMNLDASPAPTCNGCHATGNTFGAPVFSAIHTGYNSKIYSDAAGTRWADNFSVQIDSVDFDSTTNKLTVEVSAPAATVGSVSSTDIVPTVMIGQYGWDTKDYIVGAHERDADRNRLGEFEFGGTNPRFTAVSNAPGSWTFTYDMTEWAAMIGDSVKRIEVAVLPKLADDNGNIVGLNAPSLTFDLVANAADATFFDPIVEVANCNTCHDQLATTFHSGNRGGNVTVCRMCHITRAGGSHLQGQSRSIDSYVHAIHSFQPFDVDEVDVTDPVEVAHYEEHVNFLFPDFATINCEACHVDDAGNPDAAVYNVPSQAKSMPGLLSAVDEVPGLDIANASSPEVVVGPAARACGGCHRAQKLNANDAGGLVDFNQHTKEFGYRIENDDADTVLSTVITNIMALFN